MPLKPGDFGSELQSILGTEAKVHATTNQQLVCMADGRITPQVYEANDVLDGHVAPVADGQSETIMPWRIRNAHRGDILLCPGGPSGLIGALLAALSPPQDYSHCGMVLDDGRSIRHCTTTDDQLQMHASSRIPIADMPVPLDGFEESALRFGWPGTLTQSVDDARRFAQNEKTEGRALSDPSLPPSDGNKFWIHALSFNPSVLEVDNGVGSTTSKIVWPVIVSTCASVLSAQHRSEVADALDRVATAAEGLRGHYRTYAYTDANPRGGPSMVTVPVLASDGTVPAAGAGCTGAGGARVPPTASMGYQCASFIWNAVQAANAARTPGTKKVVLDGRADGQTPLHNCDRTSDIMRMPYPSDRFDAATLDGLYLYPEELRRKAAEAFHDKLIAKVHDSVDGALPQWLTLGGAALSMSLAPFLTFIGMGSVGQLAGVLGVTPEFLKFLIDVIEDMPDDVANQVGSTFAFDDATTAATDRNDWLSRPGVGRTVSPDDILHNWSPPMVAQPPEFDDDNLVGLYGRNFVAHLDPPQLRRVPVPPITWQISQGFGELRGSVFFRTVDQNGQVTQVPLPGARIRIGGMTYFTGDGGNFSVQRAPAGRYWMDVDFDDVPTGLMYTYPGEVVLVPMNGALIRQIELQPPPDTNRDVYVVLKADLLHRTLSPFEPPWRKRLFFMPTPARLGLEFFPNTPEFQTQRAQATNASFFWSGNIDDAAIIDVVVEAQLQADEALSVKCKARMRDTGTKFQDDITPFSETLGNVPPRSETLKEVGLDLISMFDEGFHVQSDRSGVLPSHAYVGIQVWNLRG
jgi:hypothetical protein